MATSSSPQEAVRKAKEAKNMMLQAALQAEMMQQSGPIDPEIQAQQITMQGPTVNPYGRMGTVPPSIYDYGNNPGGYVNMPPVFNPEVDY